MSTLCGRRCDRRLRTYVRTRRAHGRAAAANAIAQRPRGETRDYIPLWNALRNAWNARPADRAFLAEALGRFPQTEGESGQLVPDLVRLLDGNEAEQLGALRG